MLEREGVGSALLHEHLAKRLATVPAALDQWEQAPPLLLPAVQPTSTKVSDGLSHSAPYEPPSLAPRPSPAGSGGSSDATSPPAHGRCAAAQGPAVAGAGAAERRPWRAAGGPSAPRRAGGASRPR